MEERFQKLEQIAQNLEQIDTEKLSLDEFSKVWDHRTRIFLAYKRIKSELEQHQKDLDYLPKVHPDHLEGYNQNQINPRLAKIANLLDDIEIFIQTSDEKAVL